MILYFNTRFTPDSEPPSVTIVFCFSEFVVAVVFRTCCYCSVCRRRLRVCFVLPGTVLRDFGCGGTLRNHTQTEGEVPLRFGGQPSLCVPLVVRKPLKTPCYHHVMLRGLYVFMHVYFFMNSTRRDRFPTLVQVLQLPSEDAQKRRHVGHEGTLQRGAAGPGEGTVRLILGLCVRGLVAGLFIRVFLPRKFGTCFKHGVTEQTSNVGLSDVYLSFNSRVCVFLCVCEHDRVVIVVCPQLVVIYGAKYSISEIIIFDCVSLILRHPA